MNLVNWNKVLGKLERKIKKIIKKLINKYYKIRFGIKIDLDNTLPYKLGKGKFASVFRKGNYIDIIDERTKDFIRLVPYQPNHGIMIEYWKKGKLNFRTHCDFEKFVAMGDLTSERTG